MKLYYSPGACSLAPHIIAHELGLKHDLVKVDLASKKTEKGDDFYKINPKGYVPCIQLDDGTVITEGVAIDLYLSSLKPEKNITPQPGAKDFIPFLEHMLFITTELHKGVGGLFAPLPEEAKVMIRKKLESRFTVVAEHLKGKEFIHNNAFSAADAYLFTVLSWTSKVGIDLSPYPALVEFQKRVASRPSVQSAMEMEGLTQKKAA